MRRVVGGEDVDEAQVVPKSFAVFGRLEAGTDFRLETCDRETKERKGVLGHGGLQIST